MSRGGCAGSGVRGWLLLTLLLWVHLLHLHPGQVQLSPGGQLPVLGVLEQPQPDLRPEIGETRRLSTRQSRCGDVLDGS